MKLLRNPVVVGLLAVLAVGMLVYYVFWPLISGQMGRRAPRAAAAPAPTAVAAPVNPAAPSSPMAQVKDVIDKIMGNEPVPGPRLDLAAVQASGAKWLQSPRRDPFLGKRDSASRAELLLKLKAIWRQTGSALAVINRSVLSEGDTILEFTLEKIETNHVWVTGPNGREPLIFDVPRPDVIAAAEGAQPSLILELGN
jgi:hypothetical protein